MAYRLVYSFRVDWVPAGLGPGLTNPGGPGITGGPAQCLMSFNNETTTLPPTSQTFLSGDVTALTNAAAADMAAQLNSQLARIQGFASGGG